jgi:alpha-L-fucosidase
MKTLTQRSVVVTMVLSAASALGQVADDTGGSAARRADIAETGNEIRGFDMAPETRLEVVQAAVAAIPVKIPPGPFQPTWESLKAHYRVPQWFVEAKFGLFMHWGPYSVAAHHNEWYEKHMYGNFIDWHRQNFGPHDKFGYKDLIPQFTAARFDSDAWALLFKKSGARYVIPTAQHHDNFALWESAVTPYHAKAMGPKRDLIGDLAKSIRAQGLKFGVSNHGIENFQFINPPAALLNELKEKKADLFDPQWVDFYNVADRSDGACKEFLINWALRNVELIDKYQVDMLWFDNGVDMRFIDPLKLWVASYYYNRAAEWGQEVSISTKKAAYAPAGTNISTIGSIVDFEKVGGRSPAGIRTGVWQVDDPIGSTWGYTQTPRPMTVASPASILNRLIDTVSKNGNYLLNISPMADGTIPQAQQECLLEIGRWLDTNGEAIYGTHSWIRFSDTDGTPPRGAFNVRYTVKGDDLYAILIGNWPGGGDGGAGELTLHSLATGKTPQGTIRSVTMLGSPGTLRYNQDANGLKVTLPAAAPGKYAYTLKISGLKMNPPTSTPHGNPH